MIESSGSENPIEPAADETEYGSIVAEISREIVGVHARFYGRGPTRSKTIYRDGIVTCILGEIFTKAEATLVQAGQFEQVRESRQAFQDIVEPVLRQAVEEVTGLPVVAFFSQISVADFAAETFVLRSPAAPTSE